MVVGYIYIYKILLSKFELNESDDSGLYNRHSKRNGRRHQKSMSQQTCIIYLFINNGDYERWVTRKLDKSESKLNSQVRKYVKKIVKFFQNRQLVLQCSWKPKFLMVQSVDVCKINFEQRRRHNFSRSRMNKQQQVTH